MNDMMETKALEEKLMECGTAIDGAIQQIDLVLRSGQVSELAILHLKTARNALKEVMADA